jgi:Flp pilus assembly protein CpaB
MKTERKRARPIDLKRMLSTRRGIMTLATVAAVVAGAILLVFLSAYRNGLTGGGDAQTVLVAKQVIAKGAPAEVIAAEGMYQATEIDEDDAEDGAISDPDAIKEQFAAKTIFPGEQLLPDDFQANAEGFASRLAEYERAMAVPVDNYHGMVGELKAGDRVDVIGAFLLSTAGGTLVTGSATKTLLQDVLVLKAPEEREDSGTDQQEVYLKIPSDRDAEVIAYAVEVGKIWLTLRPAAGAEQHRPAFGTVQRALFGVKAVGVTRDELKKALRSR